ncbi:sodium/hydrogen exchanger 8-like [Dendronephthya gigantea]|uniref:sodium/hydrogen exchanger 8-like n=1 Tax=Dendronephthya gigantea TaxID=151771 RepID=UPI00106973FA|nr:sodium/hydrogen exchanger 8-like [Dendronephthya gigantea]
MVACWKIFSAIYFCFFLGVIALSLAESPSHSASKAATTYLSYTKATNASNGTTHPPVITTLHPTTVPTTEPAPASAEEEHEKSMEIFFILLVVGLCIFVIYFLIKRRFHYLPESVAVVFLGALVGLITKALTHFNVGNWRQEEELDPTVFFLILLPPIIFESGYSLHKGNFFANIGTIVLFAVFGTAISATVVGGGVYVLGQAGLIFKLSVVESFAFGSMISAVDPVATLAIFHALDVDPTLNMLVFGESVLNDAVSIVMTNTVIGEEGKETTSFLSAVGHFFSMFIGSACIGIAFALLSALLLKHINLRRIPSLELALILIFSYAPYGLAEGLKLSGIMAILFCGIVMSHYTHFNLSPQTQVTVQQIFRTMSFMTETCIFAYLGMAIFSLKHNFKPAFVAWSIVLCLLGRAVNIFPLSSLANLFRSVKINRKMQCIMWFSGLRGAVAFSLSTQLQFGSEQRSVLVTSTLVIVLFTILIFGGSTLPLLKCLQAERSSNRNYDISLSKTEAEDKALESEQMTDDEWRLPKRALTGFASLDAKYFMPFFTINLPRAEIHVRSSELQNLNSCYSEVSDESEREIDQTVESGKL